MIQWMIDNKEWIFSGIGITLLSFLLGSAKRTSAFTVTPYFYILMFIGIILATVADFFLNKKSEWHIRVIIFGVIIFISFLIFELLKQFKSKRKVKRDVKKLTLEECQYVEKCYKEEEFVTFDLKLQDPIPLKMKNILYVSTGDPIIIRKEYQIGVYEYAYKLIKKRLDSENR